MDAETLLRNLLEKLAKEQRYLEPDIEIKAINSGGANYTSTLFLATITEQNRDDLKLFAKVATICQSMRDSMNGDRLFNTERFIYTKLIKIYNGIQDRYQVPDEDRLIFPKFYGHSDTHLEEIVVLENLITRGFRTYNRFESINWDFAAAAVLEMAKWHALSFAYAKEDPAAFEDSLDKMQFQLGSSEAQEAWAKMAQGALQVVSDDEKVKLQNFLQKFSDPQEFKKFYRPQGAPVLTHGDYRPSNLLYRIQDGKLQVVPVDYQTVHAGCPTSDLVYFIFGGSDRDFRQKHYHQLIDHYYLQLTLALERLDIPIGQVYPRKQFDEELRETLPFGLLIGIFILPIITVEAESAPVFDKGLDELEIKPNELYASRFKGIVEDFVEWGIL